MKKSNPDKEMIENPIDEEKVAQNPGLMQYAHHAGSALVKPEDMGKVKGRAQMAMRQQTFDQLERLQKQMANLMKEAQEIQDRIKLSERIYNAQMSFEPIINHTYYLYENTDGSDMLSMIAPDQWGKKQPFNQFLAEALLLADHTWKILYNNTDDASEIIDI